MVSLISSSLVFFFTDTSSDLSGDKPCSVSTLGGVAHVYTHMGMYRYIQGMYRYIQVYIGMKAPLGENIGIHGYIWG